MLAASVPLHLLTLGQEAAPSSKFPLIWKPHHQPPQGMPHTLLRKHINTIRHSRSQEPHKFLNALNDPELVPAWHPDKYVISAHADRMTRSIRSLLNILFHVSIASCISHHKS